MDGVQSPSQERSQEINAYAKLRKHVENYRTIIVLDFDERAAEEFQRLRQFEDSHRNHGPQDRCHRVLVKDATLLTRNLVDFRKIPGLKAEDWTI